jgi:hypothetical protein
MAGDPLFINASAGAPSYIANELRQGIAVPTIYGSRNLGGRAGVRPGGTQLKVTLVSTTITVDTGVMVVSPGLTTPQGPYWCALPAQETFTLTAADATNPRKDIVVARVYDDDEDSSGLRTFRSEYLVGTPAASPAEPALPTGAVKLALIDVPKSGSGSPVVTDTRPFMASPGGVMSIADAAERALLTPYDSLAIYRRDRDWVEIYDGAAWRVQGVGVVSSTSDRDAAITSPYAGQLASDGTNGIVYIYDGAAWKTFGQNGWTTYGSAATVWTAATTNPTIGNGTFSAKYRMLDPQLCMIDVRIKIGSTTTLGSGQYSIGLPFTTAATEDPMILASGAFGSSLYSLYGWANTDSAGQAALLMYHRLNSQNNLATWTNASPVAPATGDRFHIAGIIRLP